MLEPVADGDVGQFDPLWTGERCHRASASFGSCSRLRRRRAASTVNACVPRPMATLARKLSGGRLC
jgi:hypothetical protein